LALHQQTDTTRTLFTEYGEDYVAVSGRRFQQAVVVLPREVRTDWDATDFASLSTAHFDYFLALKPEILLIGTGANQQFARPDLYRELIRAKIGIEFMNTHAACRTYNILVAEDRNVVAAVLIKTRTKNHSWLTHLQ